MSKYILPKRYMSWSQMEIWHSNKERYRREYFENGKKLDTKYLQFGKGIAKSIEDGSYKESIPDLVVYSDIEFEIKDVLVRGVPILSFIDSYDPKENVFCEYKTGKHPWTPARVQKHNQLLFYATALKAKVGHMPWYCDLTWIETSDQAVDTDDFWAQADKKLSLTGKLKSFRRNFDEREIERMEDLIESTAKEISDAYQLFIKEL